MATPKFQTDLPALPIRQDRERPRCSAPWPSYRHFWSTLGRLRQKLTRGIESCRRTQFAYRQPAVLLAVILLFGLFAGQVADADSHIPDDPDELREMGLVLGILELGFLSRRDVVHRKSSWFP